MESRVRPASSHQGVDQDDTNSKGSRVGEEGENVKLNLGVLVRSAWPLVLVGD